MNIKNFTLILLVVLILGGAYYYNSKRQMSSEENEMMENTMMTDEKTEDDAIMMEDNGMVQGMVSTNDMKNMIEQMGMSLDTVKAYTLSEPSTVSYEAQKTFLGKDPITVVGTSDKVSGYGLLDTSSNKVYLSAHADLSVLKSDSSQRDSDIQSLFSPASATIELKDYTLDGFDSQTSMGSKLTLTIPVMVTVNGITKEYPFDVEAVVTEDEFKASGTANAKMSDFGITSPSLLNVFTVADDLVLKFDVLGTKITL